MVKMGFIINLLFLVLLLIEMLIVMAYLTLFERKLLGYVQNRKGPNKVMFLGLLQPFSDMIKLISKEMFILSKVNINYYVIMPMFSLVIVMMLWLSYMFYINVIFIEAGLIYILMVMGMSVYPIMLSGWSSNSNYSMLGAIRSIAQSISYEVSLFLIIFCLILLVESFSLISFLIFQVEVKFMLMIFPVYMMFFISMLIELNRTPFDLAESESELVSGFNTEYYSSLFILIFMSEYLSIIFMSFMITIMFFGCGLMKMSFFMLMIFHMILVVLIRGVLPRIRYDQLMLMCWENFLSYSLLYIMIILSFKEIMIFYLS